jgi:hypothetical protein
LATRSLGSLTLDLALRLGAFEQGLDKAGRISQQRMKQISKNVDLAAKTIAGFAVAGVGAFTAITASMIRTADEIDKLSKISGASAGEFQRYAYGAKTLGIEQEKLGDIFKDVNDKVGDFLNTGGGALADFFEQVAPKVGVTADQFRELSGPQALGLYVDSLEKAGASQQDFTFYLEAIASDATALLPLLRNGAAGFEELGKEAELVGAILDDRTIVAAKEFSRNLDVLRLLATGVARDTAQALTPSLASLTDILLETALGAREGAEGMRDLQIEAAAMTAAALETAEKLTIVGRTAAEALSPFAAYRAFAEGEGVFNRLARGLRELEAAGGDTGLGARFFDSFLENMRELDAEIAKGRAGTTGLSRDLVDAYTKAEEALQAQLATFGLTTEAAKVRAQIELGAYGKISEAQQQNLIELAKTLDAKQALAQASADAAANAKAEADAIERQAEALLAAGRAVLDDLLTPFERAQATLNEQAATLLEAFEAGLLGGLDRAGVESAVTALVDRFNAEWATGAEDGAKQYASIFEEELAKQLAQLQIAVRQDVIDTAISLGVNIDDDALKDLQEEFKELDDLGKVFDRIGGRAGEAFGEMSRLAKDFAVLQRDQAEAGFGAYATLAAGASNALAGLAGEGSKAAKALTLASELASTAAAIHAVAQAAAAPFPAGFAAAAAMISLMQSIGALSGGSAPSAGALDGSNYGGQRGIGAGGTVLGDPSEASESIVNSIESLQSVAEKGLDINRDMLQALKNIERLQAGVGAEFARFSASFGGAQSITLGGTLGDARASEYGNAGLGAFAEFIKDPTGFIRETLEGGAPIVEGLQQIFDELGSALGSAVETFGGDADRAREVFRSLELSGATLREGDDIGEQIAELIYSVGDAAFAVASGLVGIDISQFQRLGEGALETLTRLATQFTVLTDALDQFDISIRAKPQTLIAIADELAQRAGGVEQFADNIAGLFDVILTDEQQFERLREQLTSVFDGVGESLPLTREALGELISSLDLTTESGREAFTAISEANSLLGEFFDGLEEDAEELAAAAQASADFASNLQRQIGALQAGDAELYALGVRFDDLRAQATGLGGGPLLELVNQLYQLESGALAAARAAAEAARTMDLQIRLLTAQGDESGALALTRQRELEDAATDAERALLQQIFAAEDQAAAAQAAAAAASIASRATRDYASAVGDAGKAVADERERLERELLQLVGANEELRRREREGISSSNRALFDQIEALKDHREAMDEMAKSYTDIAGSISSFRDSLVGAANDSVGASLESVRATFGDVARRARLGDIDALRSFVGAGEQLREASAAQASSQLEFMRDLARLRQEAGLAEQTALRHVDLAEASFDQLSQQTLYLAGIRGELQQLRGVPVSSLAIDADIGSVHQVNPAPAAALVPRASTSTDPETQRILTDVRRLLQQLYDNSEEGMQTGVPVRAFETSGLLTRTAA